jgi:hypothetical protein
MTLYVIEQRAFGSDGDAHDESNKDETPSKPVSRRKMGSRLFIVGNQCFNLGFQYDSGQ